MPYRIGRGNDTSFDYLLLLSWITMLVSSFMGIFRLRNIFVLLSVEAEHIKYLHLTRDDERKDDFLTTTIDKKQKLLEILGKIQIWFFFISLTIYLFYLITKMYPDMLEIIKWNP